VPDPDHGILELGEDAAERGMRAIAPGRKRCLLVGSEAGGTAAALRGDDQDGSAAPMVVGRMGAHPGSGFRRGRFRHAPDDQPVRAVPNGGAPGLQPAPQAVRRM